MGLAALLFAGCGKQQAAAPAAPAVPVVVAKAVEKDVPVELRAIGNVEALASVSLKAQVTGPVLTVHFQEGQDVRKGDLLFEIDKRPFEVALKQSQADLARDQAKAQNARVLAERYQNLFEQGIVPKLQYDTQRADAEAQEAVVQADRAAIESARLNLQYCEIRSPINGRTGSVLVRPGNLTKANDVPILVTINQITPIYVTFAIPEQNLAEVKRYNAGGKMRVTAMIPEQLNVAEQGTLSFVDNVVDYTTGTIRLKATFGNTQRRLWPGQFVTVVLTLTTQPHALVVPSQAISTSQSGSFVFVVRPDNTAEMRNVTVGRTVGGETIVEKGLQAGETVVTDGQLRLLNGSHVAPKSGS
ncbi:MAG: efflux RND transporter periplasmic adaptor subunit [Acidobacteriia bacterium]|nr:efflux RND transporter periplasmic adaptor subunit [Terriglobia bacterium]